MSNYVHHHQFNNTLTAGFSPECIADIKEIFSEYDFLAYDTASCKPPLACKNLIAFNAYALGTGEQFYQSYKNYSFTSGNNKTDTDGEQYDIVVCQVLLLIKYHHPEFFIESAGYNEKGMLLGNWKQAQDKIEKTFGYTLFPDVKINSEDNSSNSSTEEKFFSFKFDDGMIYQVKGTDIYAEMKKFETLFPDIFNNEGFSVKVLKNTK